VAHQIVAINAADVADERIAATQPPARASTLLL
jgi:hypothetical protein